ncbi:MAG TPA: hypothetical protein VGC24_10745, partial [Burkholderiaceae bacterium]
RRLDLPPGCMALSGVNWYFVKAEDFHRLCPGLTGTPLRSMMYAVLTDPPMLLRMVQQAIDRSKDGYLIPYLGAVEGQDGVHIDAMPPSLATWSIATAVRAMPPSPWGMLAWLALLASPLLAVWALFRRHRGRALALVALAGVMGYVLLSTLFGDGYVELNRHGILLFSLGCLALLALPTVAIGARRQRQAVG